MVDFWLYRALAEKVASLFASKIVDTEHQEPDESDWSWETNLEETGTEMPVAAVPRFFEILSKLFDRGFGPPQIEIIQNLTAKLRYGQARQLDFNPGRKGKSVTLQILLARTEMERITVGIRSTPAMVEAVNTLLERAQQEAESKQETESES